MQLRRHGIEKNRRLRGKLLLLSRANGQAAARGMMEHGRTGLGIHRWHENSRSSQDSDKGPVYVPESPE
jgi:hypothetical protein